MARWVLATTCFSVGSAEKVASSARQQLLEESWTTALEPATEVKKYVSPVKRVTNLLAKMKAELEAEADKEAEMYDKMVCWCETNEKEKKKAVADANAKDRELVAEIESRSARFGELSTNIAQSKKDIAENKEALETATTIREQEAAKFREEEDDMVQIITNLRNAIAVLSKHQTTQALLQMDGPVLSGLRVLLRDAALRYEELVAGRQEGQALEHTALLSLKEAVKRIQGSDAQGIDAALESALDLHGRTMSDSLPLKFAAQLVAKAAQAGRSSRPQASKFLQVDDAQPLYESRSSARSAGIYGIMNQMLEEFEAELSQEQKDELRAQANYKALAAAKTAEIDAGEKKLDEMQAEDAANQKALSDAKEDLTLTREQRTADVEFLRNLQTTCNDLDTQWEKRSATRAAETKAVAEAISILTSDDNREHLAATVALLQERSTAEVSARRVNAASMLRHAAAAPSFDADDLLAAWHGRGSPSLGAAAGPRAQLSTLAMAVQLDSFTKVKEMMDKMLANLKQEQEDEVQFKAWCVNEFDTTEKTVYDKNELKGDLEEKLDTLAKLIEKLQSEIADHKAQIADTEVEIKKASQTRENENAEFQTVVADQRATQSILSKALTKLKDFYHKGIGHVALMQRGTQEPPVKFNSYKVNEGSSPVIGLIEQIIGDSKALESETTDAEYKAQADYEKFVADSNTMIKNLEAAITAKTKATAAARADSAEAEEDLQNTNDELESLAQYTADLHNQCDFVLKNFDIRQKARNQEMEAIRAAKAILSGAGGK